MQVSSSEAAEHTRQARGAIEAIEPSGSPDRDLVFHWVLPDGRPVDKTYTQAELGMFPSQEFATMVTEVLNSFVEGEMGTKIGDLFRGDVQLPTNLQDSSALNGVVEENMALIQALVQLVQILPGFQLDIICLSLGVPRREREWAKECMQEPPHRGGLSVDEGFDILKVFLQQNALLLKETFLGKARELVEVFQLEVLGMKPETETSSEQQETEQATTTEPVPVPISPGGTPSSTSSQPTPASV